MDERLNHAPSPVLGTPLFSSLLHRHPGSLLGTIQRGGNPSGTPRLRLPTGPVGVGGRLADDDVQEMMALRVFVAVGSEIVGRSTYDEEQLGALVSLIALINVYNRLSHPTSQSQ